ncbi:MAG: ABC transporter permease [Planctomycetes bacterium]|nr:ABC transporter permease [Planctomycetota bacterium]
MTFSRLLLRNLLYHWRGNLAVFLGIALGSAVLTGALLVGDSLRGSLKALTLDRLGWVEQALVPGRFFRADLASGIGASRKAPALFLQGSASHGENRVGRVNVIGVDANFWRPDQVPEGPEFWDSDAKEVVLNRTLAKALGADAGQKIKLNVQRADNAPGETLMGSRKAESLIERIEVKVRAVVPDEGMARFSLKPSPEPVRNLFVPIGFLHKVTDLRVKGRANALFVAGAATDLQNDLHKQLTLDDWDLRYLSPRNRAEALVAMLDRFQNSAGKLKKIRWSGRVPTALAMSAEKNGGILTTKQVIDYYEENRNYATLESSRMLLEPAVIRAIEKLAPRDENKHPRWRWTPILIYLADSLGTDQAQVPYAIVAGVDDRMIFADDRIILTDWPASPFKQVKPSDPIKLVYFAPDPANHLVKRAGVFKLLTFPLPKLEGVLDDPDLTPSFPGITDQLDMGEWKNPPFPYDGKRVKPQDEDYWKRYRTTPRAYITLKKAKELWANRFGDVSSIQFRTGLDTPDKVPAALLAELKPELGGFVFQEVRKQALHASEGTTPFGVLFLSFSFFLIASALLLVGLLVRLNLDRRAKEVGVLLATGWSHRQVRRLLLGEGALLSVLGGFVGLAGAMLYAHLMLKLLAASWPGGENLNFLSLHVEALSFVIGYASSVVVSMLTLVWATRVLGKLTPRSLLQGDTLPRGAGVASLARGAGLAAPVCVLALLLAGGMIVFGLFAESPELQAGMFFGSGAMFLTAALAAIWVELGWLANSSNPRPTLFRLGIRNAGRQAVRSVLTVALLASAALLIVSVESFHKDTDHHFHQKTGGSGGFAFFADGSVPVFEDLNNPDNRAGRFDSAETKNAIFYPCRVEAGDDASCLNLYKPLKPRVMGFSKKLIDRGGFQFASSLATTEAEKSNPWLLLEKPTAGGMPAILDANTAQWILQVKLGDTIDVKNDQGENVKLKIVGLLQESIFQSEVLVSETNFLTLFPRQAGFSFFLIDVGEANPKGIKTVEKHLSKGMEEFNLEVQTTASRLQNYLAVENTYLATFQALGGLGLILGAAGLAIVLLRGVWERRAELALLLALGFRNGQLATLVLVENAFLLVLGLAAGTGSALLAVAPHLIGAGAQVLWLRIAALLVIVLVVGLASAALAVWSTLRTPVLTALRRE